MGTSFCMFLRSLFFNFFLWSVVFLQLRDSKLCILTTWTFLPVASTSFYQYFRWYYCTWLSAHKLQNWQSVFLTFHCNEIYRVEVVGLKYLTILWKFKQLWVQVRYISCTGLLSLPLIFPFLSIFFRSELFRL